MMRLQEKGEKNRSRMKRKLSSAFNNNWSINNFINDEIGYDGKKTSHR